MVAQELYDKMTMKQLPLTLARYRVQIISVERIIYPITKTQLEIYEAFSVSQPV